MGEKSITTIALKKINRGKVYQHVYRMRGGSKQQIAASLQVGSSTVSQNLIILEQEGLIERNGYLEWA